MKNTCILLSVILFLGSPSCQRPAQPVIMTVNGPIVPFDMGTVLSHEHVLVDFVGADSVSADRYDADSVFAVVLPFLENLHRAGCRTLVECTPVYLGRDPQLLRRLSKASGLHILTNTGYYGAMNNQFLPQHAKTETAEQLAGRWTNEWENGIDGTGIRPGFIKIGVKRGPLSDLHRKLVRAAALTHLQTGLVIAAHTGTAPGAFEQIAELEKTGVSPEAFIWVHAQAETDVTRHVEAAKKGAWISFDGYANGKTRQYAALLQNMKSSQLLSRVLISHDAGWYHVGEPGGGHFRDFTPVFEKLVPALRDNGFTRREIDLILHDNPARAFRIDVRRAG